MSDENYSNDVEPSSEENLETESSEASDYNETEELQASDTDQLRQDIDDAIENGASEEEIKEMIEEFELKVNGKTVKRKLDLHDKEAVKRELQMAAAGRQSMQELAELKKLYTQELGRLKENPWSVLEELGLNPEDLAESLLREKVEEAKKSPEQLEKEKMQRELEAARKELERQKQEADQARMSQLEAEAAQELETEIMSALDAHTTLPKSPKTIARIADTMLWAMENGFNDVGVKDVLPTVEDEIRRELQQFMSDLPEEMFENYLGKKNMERMRQRRLKEMKKQPVRPDLKPTSEGVKKDESRDSKKMKMKDFFKNL